MCGMRLAENTGCKKDAKIGQLRTIAQLWRAISLQLRHVSTIEKNLLNSNTSSTCPDNMMNFGPLTEETDWQVWGTPANFKGVRVLASLLQWHRSAEVNQTLHNARCLAVCWAGILYIYFPGLLPTNGILPGAKFTLRQSLAFSCFGNITARHWSSAVGVSQTLRRGARNGIMELSLLIIFNSGRHLYSEGGHHVGHRPTF